MAERRKPLSSNDSDNRQTLLNKFGYPPPFVAFKDTDSLIETARNQPNPHSVQLYVVLRSYSKGQLPKPTYRILSITPANMPLPSYNPVLGNRYTETEIVVSFATDMEVFVVRLEMNDCKDTSVDIVGSSATGEGAEEKLEDNVGVVVGELSKMAQWEEKRELENESRNGKRKDTREDREIHIRWTSVDERVEGCRVGVGTGEERQCWWWEIVKVDDMGGGVDVLQSSLDRLPPPKRRCTESGYEDAMMD